jgi:hypothetical protein
MWNSLTAMTTRGEEIVIMDDALTDQSCTVLQQEKRSSWSTKRTDFLYPIK